MQRQPVMLLAESDIGGVPHPIAHLGAEEFAPHLLVLGRRCRSQRDRFKAGHACVARGKEAPARMHRPNDELEPIAAVVGEGQEALHLARLRRLCASPFYLQAMRGERLGRALQRFGAAHFQPDRLLLRPAAKIDERRIAKVGAEIGVVFGPLGQLQPENALGEIDRARQIGGRQAHISQLLDGDHYSYPPNSTAS